MEVSGSDERQLINDFFNKKNPYFQFDKDPFGFSIQSVLWGIGFNAEVNELNRDKKYVEEYLHLSSLFLESTAAVGYPSFGKPLQDWTKYNMVNYPNNLIKNYLTPSRLLSYTVFCSSVYSLESDFKKNYIQRNNIETGSIDYYKAIFGFPNAKYKENDTVIKFGETFSKLMRRTDDEAYTEFYNLLNSPDVYKKMNFKRGGRTPTEAVQMGFSVPVMEYDEEFIVDLYKEVSSTKDVDPKRLVTLRDNEPAAFIRLVEKTNPIFMKKGVDLLTLVQTEFSENGMIAS